MTASFEGEHSKINYHVSSVGGRLLLAALAELYYLLLCLEHNGYIVRIWWYYGFRNLPSYGLHFSNILIVGLMAALMGPLATKPSHYIRHLAYIGVIIPLLCIAATEGKDISEYITVVIGSLTFLFLPFGNGAAKKKPFIELPNTYLLVIMGTFSLFVGGGLVVALGFKPLTFGSEEIYGFRTQLSSRLPPLFDYLWPILAWVVAPYLTIDGLEQKNRLEVAAGFFVSFIVFSTTYMKSTLMIPAACLATYCMFGSPTKSIYRLYSAIIFLILFCVVITFNSVHTVEFADSTVRRLMYVPSLITYRYLEYFNGGNFLHWSQSKLTMGLVPDPLDGRDSSLAVGSFMGLPGASPNTGWVGSGYMQAGVLGTIAYSLLLAGICMICDRIAAAKDSTKFISVFFGTTLTFLLPSSDVLTVLLTFGMGVALLMCAIRPAALGYATWGSHIVKPASKFIFGKAYDRTGH